MRTAIFKLLRLGLALLLFMPTAGAALAAGGMQVTALKLIGLERTDPAWLTSYIDYQLPAEMTEAELPEIEKRLLTTAVFTWVKASLLPVAGDSSGAVQYVLQVEVQERWTTIPVARAAYGGGTPLKVLGIYDIHTFGRLLTLGAEARQYGTAPPGFIVYGRDPRGDSDRHYLGAEVWREFRRRQVIASSGAVVGALSTNMTLGRLRLLVPFAGEGPGRAHAWKYGGDLETTQEAPSVYDPGPAKTTSLVPPRGIALNERRRFAVKLLPTLLYDDVVVNHIEYDGLRAKGRWGPIFTAGSTYGLAEAEADYYRLLPAGWNFAMRVFTGQTDFLSLQSEYFLGGLDTIRGLPDGAIYGTRAAYANLEMRKVVMKLHYLWLQSALFVDAGGAGASWAEARDQTRSTAGFGLRLAVPQVYRLVLRVDYAWSVSGPHTQGLTAGLNQFFDPYIPL